MKEVEFYTIKDLSFPKFDNIPDGYSEEYYHLIINYLIRSHRNGYQWTTLNINVLRSCYGRLDWYLKSLVKMGIIEFQINSFGKKSYQTKTKNNSGRSAKYKITSEYQNKDIVSIKIETPKICKVFNTMIMVVASLDETCWIDTPYNIKEALSTI
jgi:hypothetical protein